MTKDNVSRALVEHFTDSTARVNAEERRRLRRDRLRKLGIAAFVVACFAAGLIAVVRW